MMPQESQHPLQRVKTSHMTKNRQRARLVFFAEIDGLFKIDEDRLFELNMLGTTSLPSIHNNMGVEKGKQVAAFRIIPLVCENETMDKLKAILSKPLFSVKPYRAKTASLLITGTEVYEGKIKDGFKPVIEAKLKKNTGLSL